MTSSIIVFYTFGSYAEWMQNVIVDTDITKRAAELISPLADAKSVLVVADKNTYKALGGKLEEAFIHTSIAVNTIIFEGKVDACEAHVEHIKSAYKDGELIVAVGSGTINDLCKYASFQLNIPYVIFPTAPSMNGYLSSNASIEVNNIKCSLPAHEPAGVFCDIETLRLAPLPLIKAGLGDSLCRPTAQADWLLSHLLLGTSYDETPFEWLGEYENELFNHSDKLVERDAGAICLLIETLLASGMGMTHCGGSYPASQGEHMIAHTMHMLYGEELLAHLHGEEIGVTTLAMAKLQHKLMGKKPVIKASNPSEAGFQRIFGKKRGLEMHHSFQDKAITAEKAEMLNDKIAEHWPEWKERLLAVMIKPEKLAISLHRANAFASSAQLGWDKDRFEHALTSAHLMRNRFTFLDIAAMGGGRYWWD